MKISNMKKKRSVSYMRSVSSVLHIMQQKQNLVVSQGKIHLEDLIVNHQEKLR